MGSGASISAKGYNYAVSTQSFPSIYFGLNDSYNPAMPHVQFPAVVANAVKKVMSSAGFTVSNSTYSIAGYYSDPSQTSSPEYTAYKKNSITCLYIYDANQTVATFSRFAPDDVSKAFAQAQPYMSSYENSTTAARTQDITFGPVTIKSKDKSGVIGPSKTAGYDISETVLTEDGIKKLALFYNKNAGPWTFITQANDEFGFSCDAYNANADVAKAMYGQVCLGPQGQIHFGTGTSALQ